MLNYFRVENFPSLNPQLPKRTKNAVHNWAWNETSFTCVCAIHFAREIIIACCINTVFRLCSPVCSRRCFRYFARRVYTRAMHACRHHSTLFRNWFVCEDVKTTFMRARKNCRESFDLGYEFSDRGRGKKLRDRATDKITIVAINS